jgi:hypothetical protein
MKREERERLRKLCEEATPGPWELGVTDTATPEEVAEHMSKNAIMSGGPVAWLLLHPEDYDGTAKIQHARATLTTGNGPTSEANARLVSAARTALPALLYQLEAVEAERGRMREALRACVAHLTQWSSAGSRGCAPGHGHAIPGVWDDDNGAKSGRRCEWCAAWPGILELAALGREGEEST